MRRLVLFMLPALALTGCGGHAEQETQTTVTKNGVTTTTITKREVGKDETRARAKADDATVSGLNIDSDKFKANFQIPGLSFGGDDMDLSGMKLYPGSTVKGVRVHAVDRGGHSRGEVTMDYSSPAAPLTVAQHMADQARHAGFALTANSAALVAGTKPSDDGTDSFTMTFGPNGSATVGQLTMTGAKTKSGD